MPSPISIVPANRASFEDLQAVFGTRGPASRCQCQRFKLRPREAFAKFPVEERAHRLRTQTECGRPDSATTSGLVAYLDGEPVATARGTFAAHGVVMNGGSTLTRARGRGIYRALVAARWDDAVARGTPYLTTVARPSSAPILARMGLVEVCTVRVLNDEF